MLPGDSDNLESRDKFDQDLDDLLKQAQDMLLSDGDNNRRLAEISR